MTYVSENHAFVAIKKHLKDAVEASEYRAARKALQAALGELENLPQTQRLDVEVSIWRDYSVIASHFGDLKTAIEYERKLTARCPDDPYPHMTLSRLYSETDQPERAADSLLRCAELAEGRDDKRLLAVLATKGHLPTNKDALSRRLADAVAFYQEVLRDCSSDVSSERYGEVQQRLGDLYRAQAELLPRADRARTLGEAANAYREALKAYDTRAFPKENRELRARLKEIEKLV